MSGRRSISNSFNVITVDDPVSAFVVDLENEMTNLALDENGNLVSAFDIYFKVRAYYGSQNVISDNACSISASCSDSDVTLSTTYAKTTGIRVQIASGVAMADTTEISVIVTHTTYGTRTVVFTLAGVRGGSNGDDAVLQELLPSISDISFARQTDGSLTPASRDLTLSIKKTQGSSTSTQSISESGLTIRWSTSSMPANSTDGNSWGSGTTTGISWSNITMQIANNVTATNIYIAAFKTSGGTLVDRETIPIVKDGNNGDDGISYCFVFTKAAARVNENNTVTAELAGYAYKYVGGVRSALTSTTIRYGYILNDSSTYADTTTNDSGFFDAGTWFNDDDITDYGKNSPSIFAAIVIGGTVVHAEMITISIKGRTGSRGKVGRFFYYAGAFNVSDNTTQFLVNDAQSPYFSYNNQYWVYNPEYNPSGGTTTMSAMGTPSSSSSNWKIMTNDFKYIITEAIFGSYAHFGSAIINGDWLLSTNGTINGVAYNNGALYNGAPAYTWFDPQYPNKSVNTTHSVNGKEWTGYNFVPNYAVDLLTGKSYQNEAYIKGQIVATSGSIDSITATNLNIKSGTITGDVTIGDDGVNIKLRPTGSGSGVGASIVAYDGTLTPFSLLFDRYSYSGTYYPHATLKLESAAPYLSKYGKIEIKDTESKRTLYYGSSQIPDYTYTLYEGFESITNFTGFVSKFSVNNAYHLRIGITRTGVAYIMADAIPTANDVSNLPTGCFYREGNTLKIKI